MASSESERSLTGMCNPEVLLHYGPVGGALDQLGISRQTRPVWAPGISGLKHPHCFSYFCAFWPFAYWEVWQYLNMTFLLYLQNPCKWHVSLHLCHPAFSNEPVFKTEAKGLVVILLISFYKIFDSSNFLQSVSAMWCWQGLSSEWAPHRDIASWKETCIS